MEEKLQDPAPCEEDAWFWVAHSHQLHNGGRVHTLIEGRYISIFRIDDALHALDSICYHAGGPLTTGDIEDVDGHLCIRCPWHRYNVTLCGGQLVYEGAEFKEGRFQSTGWKLGKTTQRTHNISEIGGNIYVQLNTHGEYSSDQFAVSTRRQRFELLADPPRKLNTKPGEEDIGVIIN